MAARMDMSLDEIIQRSAAESSAARRRPRPPPSGPGPSRRIPVRVSSLTTPYSMPQVGRQMWQTSYETNMEMVMDRVRDAEAESGTKLYISNLDYGVSNGDIKLLFAEEGELKRYSIHYDKSGRSKGTAEVVFVNQSDAIAAMRKYNNVKLDGKPLQIELVGANLEDPADMPLIRDGILGGRPNNAFLYGQGRVEHRMFFNGIASNRLPRGHGGNMHVGRLPYGGGRDENFARHRPKGHREMKDHSGKVSFKDLDEELDQYHSEAMKLGKRGGN